MRKGGRALLSASLRGSTHTNGFVSSTWAVPTYRQTCKASRGIATRSAPLVSAFRTTSAFVVPGHITASRVVARLTKHDKLREMSVFISTESTPNSDSLKFVVDVKVIDGVMDFPNRQAAKASPLASAIFQVEGVQRVFFGNEFITVTKDEHLPWGALKPPIYEAIQNFYISGDPILFAEGEGPPPCDTDILPDDSPVVAAIKEILETRIRPAVQGDGGNILFRGFDDSTGTVYLELQGSCSGCSSSQATLKGGVERTLMYYVPEVETIQEVNEKDELIMEQFRAFEAKLKAQQTEQPKAEEKSATN